MLKSSARGRLPFTTPLFTQASWSSFGGCEKCSAALEINSTAGTGPLYQGRFKSFPIQQDDHFLTVCRYVKRNALRANLVRRAQDWRWCSLWHRQQHTQMPWLSAWSVAVPAAGVAYVEEAQTDN